MSNAGSSPLRSQHSSNSSMSSRSPMERKESLRAVLSRAQNLQNNNEMTMKHLEEVIKQADDINLEASIEDKATCQDEIVIDSQVMTVSSSVLKTVSTSLTKELNPYNFKDFAEKLMSYVHMLPDATNEDIDWSMLEEEVAKLFKKTPNYSTLSGCLDPLEKKAVPVRRQPAKKEAQAPMRRPEAIVNADTEEHSVEQTVQNIRILISERCRETGSPIDYFRLILHPQSFGKTVENMLHVSFLVRDGIMNMVIDDDGNLVIEPTTKEIRAQAKRSGKQGNVQNVVEMNVDQWRMLVGRHKITEPMLNF